MKKAIFFVSVALLLLITAISVYFEDVNCASSVEIIVDAPGDVSQKISLYQKDEKYYAFLPSHADLLNIGIKHKPGYTAYLDGKCFKTGAFSEILANKEYTFEMKNFIGISVCKSTLIFMRSSHIPSLSITLVDGTIEDLNADKNVSKTGYMSVVESNGNVDYFGAFQEIHGRGNTTWGQEKKPYVIEFSEDIDLLGMGGATKYCLMANACDESNLKNKMVFDAAKECGVKGAIDSAFVDFFIDGQYMGLYLLTEAIGLGEERINITDLEAVTRQGNLKALNNYGNIIENKNGIVTKSWQIPFSPKDTSGGYIIEFDEIGRMDDESSYFILSDKSAFCLKAPKYATELQIEYISGVMDDIITDLDNNMINERIDMDSWLSYYFIQELFANADIYSIYFYKDSDAKDPKIYAGPIWDFDLSMGTMFLGREENPAVFFANTHGIYGKLYQIEAFREAVKVAYINDYRQLLNEYSTTKLEEYKELIADSYMMNSIRWEGIQYYEYDAHFKSFSEHIDFLSSYLQKRIEFLDDAWIKEKDFCRVYYKSDGPALYEKHMCSVERGEVLGEIPEPNCSGFRFLGYYDANGTPYDPTKPVTENVMYIAKWERVPGEPIEHEALRQLTIKERILLKLNDERVYLILGMVFMSLIVVTFLFSDFKNVVRTRRCRNDRKQ